MEQKINLEEILHSFCKDENKVNKDNIPYILEAMKEAVRQGLELAAENATMTCRYTVEEKDNNHIDYSGKYLVNKESIINVINLVE